MDTEIKAEFEKDERVMSIRVYHDGWVPNAYKYRAPGRMTTYYRDGREVGGAYDRKRSRGVGPYLVAFSERDGRLASR